MNILFNATPLLTPLTGIGQYVLQLFSELNKNPNIQLYAYYPFGLKKGFFLPSFNESKAEDSFKNNIKKNAVRFLTKIPFQRDLRHFLEPLVFQHRVQNLPKNTIYHEPSYVCFPFDNAKATTICDLSTFDCPEFHPVSRVRFLEKGLPKTLETAEKIFVISQFTKQRLQHWFSVPEDKIVCTYLAARAAFHPRTEMACQSALQKYNLKSKSYVLSIGTLEPRKNLTRLFEAFALLPSTLRKCYPLAIAGKEGWHEKGLIRAAQILEEKGELCFLGFVPDSDLPFLLNAAAAFAYPSIYEGFGLPVLEALASSTPTVASNATSIPEVAGDAALLHAPEDVESLKNHLQHILENKALADSLAKKGLEQAQKFSWAKCAEDTATAYADILPC